MILMGGKEEYAEEFIEFCFACFINNVIDILRKEFRLLDQYKSYEPEELKKVFLNFQDEEMIVDQAARILSLLVLVQAFPNANHRTAFKFVGLYLSKQGIHTVKYEDAPEKYHDFYQTSKRLLGHGIEHGRIFDVKYIDVHHQIGIEDHFKAAKKQMIKIMGPDQSGIKTEESLQSFISSLNQSGTFP
jgi:prophage maintenance system killer protein